jgi:hypothetical protein
MSIYFYYIIKKEVHKKLLNPIKYMTWVARAGGGWG